MNYQYFGHMTQMSGLYSSSYTGSLALSAVSKLIECYQQ